MRPHSASPARTRTTAPSMTAGPRQRRLLMDEALSPYADAIRTVAVPADYLVLSPIRRVVHQERGCRRLGHAEPKHHADHVVRAEDEDGRGLETVHASESEVANGAVRDQQEWEPIAVHARLDDRRLSHVCHPDLGAAIGRRPQPYADTLVRAEDPELARSHRRTHVATGRRLGDGGERSRAAVLAREENFAALRDQEPENDGDGHDRRGRLETDRHQSWPNTLCLLPSMP